VPGDSDELVTTDPRDEVAGPHVAGDAPGRCDEQLVADGVAVAVVDQLEAVQVEEQHADRVADAGGPGELVPQPFVQRLPVAQPGQLVAEGELAGGGLAGRVGVDGLHQASQHHAGQPGDQRDPHQPVQRAVGRHRRGQDRRCEQRDAHDQQPPAAPRLGRRQRRGAQPTGGRVQSRGGEGAEGDHEGRVSQRRGALFRAADIV
jgi:hypothetical protein